MKNSEYWEKRIANNTWQTYNSLEEKNRALLEMYQDASLSISEELYKVAEKLSKSNPTLSDMHKFNRLTDLQKNIENIIRDLGENVDSFGKSNMLEGFKETYSNVMTKLGITKFDEVPKKVMEEMLRKPWLGSNFSERLWKNTQVLASNLNELLTNGIIQGKTITEISIQLNNRMNEGFNVSHRLIRTETMHYLNESAKKAYKDGGCEEVQLWAAVDERTCSTCGVKHGNIYRLKDCPTLPLHANCRCTILPVVDIKNAKTDHDKAKETVNNEFNRRKTEVLFHEEIKITKKNVNNDYTVNRKLVNSKGYHDKFELLPLKKQVKENIYIESKTILEHRDGTEFEDLIVLDSMTGKEIVSNRKSNSSLKTGISKEDYEKVINHTNDIILLHNHPGGGRLSISDILTAFKHQNVRCSIVVGHDGSVHVVDKLKRDINVEKMYNEAYNNYKHQGFPEGMAILKATDEIYKLECFEYNEL